MLLLVAEIPMSTFDGFLNDSALGFIAIDKFTSITYKCTVFMLSHIHTDHTKGLFSDAFASLLSEFADKFVYCSPVTAHILTKKKRTFPREKIVHLEINRPFILRHSNVETDIVVTALAAGHCPGSTMFMIEYNNKRCLYTGDVRMNIVNLKNMRSRISNPDGSVMKINDLYLDTTFAMSSNFDDFPAREDCENFILNVVKEWLTASEVTGESVRILLDLPYKCGVEYLYQSFYKTFKKPVSVHDYDYYHQIEEMRHCVTPHDDSDDCFMHACIRRDSCPWRDRLDLKIIKPCVLTFMISNLKSVSVDEKYKVPFLIENNQLKFLYSSHCSLNELRDLVEYLKPDKIFPNVVDSKYHISGAEILKLLRSRNSSNSEILKTKSSELQKRSSGVTQIGVTLSKTIPKRSRVENEAHFQNIAKKLDLRI